MGKMNKFVDENETENVEFKSVSSGTLPQNIWEPITAFSNADGGSIIFGVDPKGNILGVDACFQDKLMSDISSYCNTKFNHRLYPEISSDNCIIRVFIPPVPASLRPIYTTSRGCPSGGRVRVGTTNVQLDDEWIRRFAIAAHGGAELLSFPYYYEDYFDKKSIDRYLQVVKKRRGNVYSDLSIEEILKKLRAIGQENQVTMFGLLAFSSPYGLQELTAPTVDVAVTQYAGNTKVNPSDIAEVSLDDKEFSGNAVSQFENALTLILTKLPLRGRIESGGKRSEYLAIPEVALRETLANAIAHRDYTTYSGRIQVDIYSDRIEFSNPGRSLVPLNQLENAHPQTRNPLLMSYLRDLNITEHRGRGIRTIKNSLKSAGLAEPRFEHKHDWFVATLYSSAFIKDDDQIWLQQFQAHGLNERQLKALVHSKHNTQGINNSEYRDLNNMNHVGDDRKANYELTRLVRLRLVRPVGQAKSRRYILNRKHGFPPIS